MRAACHARRALMPVMRCFRSRYAIASAETTGPSAASLRTAGASRLAIEVSQGKFVSLMAARKSA